VYMLRSTHRPNRIDRIDRSTPHVYITNHTTTYNIYTGATAARIRLALRRGLRGRVCGARADGGVGGGGGASFFGGGGGRGGAGGIAGDAGIM
jgi:hypothetical protein